MNTPENSHDIEAIERNKNKLDLKPNIDFISKNRDKFKQGHKAILERKPSESAEKWAEKIQFIGAEDFVMPQLSPQEIKEILSRMPDVLIALSKLKTISYHFADSGRHLLPIPIFNPEGNFKGQVCAVDPADFPRKSDKEYKVYKWEKKDRGWTFSGNNEIAMENDHPSRILVGCRIGETIYPTPIPKTVSEDERAVYLYQVHVLLHEFFHTIEKSEILLETDGEQFTLEDWLQDWENLILSGKEPKCVSSYAETYSDDLTRETKTKDYEIFFHALNEQICESFVAYQLGIISNDEGWTDFKKESFGNESQKDKCEKSESPCANLKWQLMDKLCRAKVIGAN
jgi:hypothetical protein